MGEQRGASGAEVLEAYIVGVEVECKLGLPTANPSYVRGWQTSCTLGVIGATAGCGRLLGLDVETMSHAIGLAVAQASGNRRSFGSMGKPFQLGRASQSAVLAAELAALGVTGGAQAIEGEAGVTSRSTPSAATARSWPHCLASRSTWSTRASISSCIPAAAQPTRRSRRCSRRPGALTRHVERIVVDVPFTAPIVAHQHRPTSGLEAKFSLEYVLAAALLDGEVGLEQFSDQAVARPQAQALLQRVEARVPPDMQRGAQPWPPAVESRAELHLANGDVRRAEVVVRKGQSQLTPLSDDDLAAKFRACARRQLGATGVERAMELVRSLESLPEISELTKALAAPSSEA